MIDVRDLCFHYQGSKHQVFSHFALQLQPGSVYGLLGKNGTGKSTLLYLISGLLRPDSGTVKVDGMESQLRLPEMLQEVFIVPEEYAMPDMSFEAFADMMRAFYPHFSDDLLAKCLADFEMPARPNLKELSMGQKARPRGHHQPKSRTAQQFHRRHLSSLRLPLPLAAGDGRPCALRRAEPARQRRHHATWRR